MKNPVARIGHLVPTTVRGPLRFELKSWWGRHIRTRRLSHRQSGLLNLGCGASIYEGYVNADFFGTPGADLEADFRYPLPLTDGSMHGVFCEHTLEHFTYAQARFLLCECARVLRAGAAMRVAVPDVGLFAAKYSRGDEAWFREWERLMFLDSADVERRRRRLRSPMEAISFVTQEYGHSSCWDFETLKDYLEESGFVSVTRCGFRSGGYPELLMDMDSDDRKWVSLYVEAVRRGAA